MPKAPDAPRAPKAPKFLSNLHPNTILKSNLDPNAHPNPSVVLIKTEYWDRAGGGGNISYDW